MPHARMYRIDIVTLFPDVVTPYCNASIMQRAQKKQRVRFGVHDLRQWGEGKRRTVEIGRASCRERV